MSARLVVDEKNTIRIMDGIRGNPNMTIINESGLWSLVLTSRKDAATRLDDDERGVSNVYTLGGPQEMTIINESGLYSVILKSPIEARRGHRSGSMVVSYQTIAKVPSTGFYGALGGILQTTLQPTKGVLILRGLIWSSISDIGLYLKQRQPSRQG